MLRHIPSGGERGAGRRDLQAVAGVMGDAGSAVKGRPSLAAFLLIDVHALLLYQIPRHA